VLGPRVARFDRHYEAKFEVFQTFQVSASTFPSPLLRRVILLASSILFCPEEGFICFFSYHPIIFLSRNSSKIDLREDGLVTTDIIFETLSVFPLPHAPFFPRVGVATHDPPWTQPVLNDTLRSFFRDRLSRLPPSFLGWTKPLIRMFT